jgi:thiamine-phosphate pyrophosphorylase
MLARGAWQTGGVSDRLQRLSRARLYLVCDERDSTFLHAALRGGVDIVQLRVKDAPDDVILAAAQRTARICAEHGALFILNDRPDLAARAGADGVHVGQDDAAVGDARSVVGAQRLVGLSTHTPEQVDAAGSAGVDYIGVGPVHATPTKPGRPAVGLALVGYAAEHARVPFFAIGGICAANVTSVLEAGARRVAVVRALVEAEDPEAAAARLAAALASNPLASNGEGASVVRA